VPGVAKLDRGVKKGNLVAIYTGKGEGVALMEAAKSAEETVTDKTGVAAVAKRVLMEPGTYPRLWK